MERIFFDDYAVLEAVHLYDMAMYRMSEIENLLQQSEQEFKSCSKEEQFSESYAMLYRIWEDTYQRLALLKNKLLSVRDVYCETELKNLKMVSQMGNRMNEEERGLMHMLHGDITVNAGEMVYRRSIQHEDWLVRAMDELSEGESIW